MNSKKKKLKVLMASSEMSPFAKVGGLADVVGSLPTALKTLKVDVRVIIPKYGFIDKNKYSLKKIARNIIVSPRIRVNVWETEVDQKIKVYFIESKKYFNRPTVYWGNNSERFLFFSLAVLKVLPVLKFKPDIIHCHDYHTAMIPDLLKIQKNNFYKNIKTLLTIHNLNYQGKEGPEILSTGQLSVNSLKSLSDDARDGDINFMVQGILNADIINTVSPTYAREILKPSFSCGLDKILKKRKKDLYGILNGIDVNFFNPQTDVFIKQNYSFKALDKKVKNKLYLQEKLGWKPSPNKMLIGLVSRLVWQKGVDLIKKYFARLNCQFVFLGTGYPEYENHLKDLNRKHPLKFKALIKFDIKLAQEIYAGADAFLMPSRFEPCGLGQMIAMRYGALPIVHTTGGLADTVDGEVGFRFRNFSSKNLYNTIEKAISVYKNSPKKWQKMQKIAMQKDFSWKNSAKRYLDLYYKIAK